MASEPTLADIVGTSSTPQTDAYLKHLTTLPLTDLVAEPVALQTQVHHLTSSLVTLANASYPTFLAVHQSTSTLNASLTSLSTSLDALANDSLPALERCASGWKARTDSVLGDRKRARVVLEQHEKLRDLLDIPLLIDTCVRNGYFGEALALAAHARSVGKAFDRVDIVDANDGDGAASHSRVSSSGTSHASPNPPLIISSVLAEVDQSITQMLVSLLATLHEPHRKLPALWKAVNFLRRMDVFGSSSKLSSAAPPQATHGINGKLSIGQSLPIVEDVDEAVGAELQIALAFLSGRETCLVASLDGCGKDVQAVIRALQGSKPEANVDFDDYGDTRQLEERELEDIARYLKKYIDTWREGVYDIITQYSTIFLERFPFQPLNASPNPSQPQASTLQIRQQLHSSLHALISDFGSHALTKHLLPTLSSASPLLALTSLPSLLTQLTYCASAFGRVGLDFRPLLSTIIGDAVVAAVGRELRTSSKTWMQSIAKSYYSPENEADAGKGKTASTTTSIAMSRSTSSGSSSGPRVERPPSKWIVSPSLVDSPPRPDPSAPIAPVHIPPPILVSYPPLAILTNAYLTTLNGLRLLAPIHVRERLANLLDGALAKCGQSYLRYANVLHPEGRDGIVDAKELTVAEACGDVYFNVFVPFMRRALVEGVYSGSVEEVYSSVRERQGGKTLEDTKGEWEAWCNGGSS